MKASRTILVAASVFLAAGSAGLGPTGAAAGLRPPVSAHAAVSVGRGGERHAIGEGRHRDRGGYGGELDLSGVAGPMGGETPVGQEEEAPQPAALCPPFAAAGRAAAFSSGPRIIEVAALAPVARRGPLPIVVYGDSLR